MTPDTTLTIPHWPPSVEDIRNLFKHIECLGEVVGEVHLSPETSDLLSPTHKKLEYVWGALVVHKPELNREIHVLNYVGNPCAERIYVVSLRYQNTPS